MRGCFRGRELAVQMRLGTATGLIHAMALAWAGLEVPPYVLRHLQTELYGQWVILASLAAYVSLLELGLTPGLVKLWAEEFSSEDAGAAAGATRSVVVVLLAGTLGPLLPLGWLRSLVDIGPV
jgi:hypothetical protein